MATALGDRESLFFGALCESGGHHSFPSPPVHFYITTSLAFLIHFSPHLKSQACALYCGQVQMLPSRPCSLLHASLSFLSPSHNESLHLFPISSPGFHPLPPQPSPPGSYSSYTPFVMAVVCRGSRRDHSSPSPDRSLSRAQTTLSCLPSTRGRSELYPVRGNYLLDGIIFIEPLNPGNGSSSTHMAFGKHQPTELLGSATDSAVSSFSVQLGMQALRSS